MSLTREDVQHLLALVAVLDDRDTDDPLLLSAWVAMAEEGEWPSFQAAKRALMVYRTEHPDYPVRPGHISQVLQRVRDQARAAYQVPKLDDFPKEALDDTLEYQRFLNRCVADHYRRWMEAFERGERPERPVSKLEQAAAKRAIEPGDGDTPIRSAS